MGRKWKWYYYPGEEDVHDDDGNVRLHKVEYVFLLVFASDWVWDGNEVGDEVVGALTRYWTLEGGFVSGAARSTELESWGIRNVLVFIRFCKFSRETKIVVVANLSIVMLVPRLPSMALLSKSVCYTILIMLDRRILVLDQLIIP